MVQTRSQKKMDETAMKSQPSTAENESQLTNNGHESSHEETFTVTAPEVDGELLHAVEHHRGRSSSFSTKDDDIKKDAVENLEHKSSRYPSILGCVALLLISYFTYPDSLHLTGEPSVRHVWYYGWITAISTGLGVLPLIFVPHLDKFWIGVSNGEFRFLVFSTRTSGRCTGMERLNGNLTSNLCLIFFSCCPL